MALVKSIGAVVLFNALILTNSILAGIRKDDITFYFQERIGVTFFSALILGCTAVVCFILSRLYRLLDEKNPFINFWLFSAIGFFYLCMDEYFMIHEGMDRAILKLLGQDPRLYNFDGWILAFFGVIGVWLFFKYARELLQYKGFLVHFWLGVFFFSLMVLFDQVFHFGETGMVIEDSFKLVGVCFLFAGYVNALLSMQERALEPRKG